jgi:hypothetical protein
MPCVSCTCGGDAADSASSAAPTSTVSAPSTAAPTSTAAPVADVRAYCEFMAVVNVDQPESYVGSAQHVADAERLAALAPSDVKGQLQAYADFIRSGAVTPDDPDSLLVENWPPEVGTAVDEIVAFNDANC